MALYDFMNGYITVVPYAMFWGLTDLSGNEIGSFPTTVYNVNHVAIGTATDKQDYMNKWNADADNRAVGKLTGYYGPFAFEMLVNGAAPAIIVSANRRKTDTGDIRKTNTGDTRIYN